MYVTGIRNAEACAVDFDDIKRMQSHPECTVAWIYKTTGYDNSTRKLGGKSKNADRIIPIPNVVAEIINERRRQLEEMLGIDVGNFPIACLEYHWEKRCSARQLTAAARKLFQSIDMDAAQVSMIDDDLRTDHDFDFPFDEAEPTAYLFRRNFGTHMHVLGLTEAEIQYVMGHDINANPYETRNEFVDEEKLCQIHLKMSQRPLVNEITEDLIPVHIDAGNTTQISGRSSLHLPVSDCKIKLHLQANEPLDGIQVKISSRPRKMSIKCDNDLYLSSTTHGSRSVDVRKQYQKVYRKK